MELRPLKNWTVTIALSSTRKNSTQSEFTGSSKRPCEKLSHQMYTFMFNLATWASKSFPLYYSVFFNVYRGVTYISAHNWLPKLAKLNRNTTKSHSWVRLMNNIYHHSNWSAPQSSGSQLMSHYLLYLLFQNVSSPKRVWLPPSQHICI